MIAFEEGETVWCPPDIDHWHGATPHQVMTHLVITGSKDGENVVWKEPVSEADYQRAVEQTHRAEVSLDGVQSQLQAHIGIAANAGLSGQQIRELAVVLTQQVGKPEGRRVEQAIEAALPDEDGLPAGGQDA